MDVLARWLWEKLSMPAKCAIDQVIHCEIIICRQDASDGLPGCEVLIPKSEADPDDLNVAYIFRGTSKSGDRLLNSLKEYASSYEQQKWARWVHRIKASDFIAKDARSDDKVE